MPYVARNAEGLIVAISAETMPGAEEWLEPAAVELQEFLARVAPGDELARSDQSLIRVVEDLVNTLIDKNLIRFTDLPDAAQQKLVLRRSLRRSRAALDLLGDGSGPGPVIKL